MYYIVLNFMHLCIYITTTKKRQEKSSKIEYKMHTASTTKMQMKYKEKKTTFYTNIISEHI